ncbi:30S ribosomal protein S11 [Candidatus Dojkabacteria bacterium]|nr:30S ribosomal protein S11 [Candidatus Dojkabacteria bacterium]
MATTANTKTKKTAKKKSVQTGVVSIQTTFNNTIISICDENGELLVQGSPAVVGFKGSKRSTAFAATKAAMHAGEIAVKRFGLKEAKAIIKGPGAGRNATIKGLDSVGIKITQLIDKTPLPHNGCRPRKLPRK